jgi:hypothetical protein
VAAFAEHRQRVLELLPEAEVEHVGSTAIGGALTKGDLDLLVRVQAGRFDAAVAGLLGLYAVDQLENWTATFASFADPQAADPPVGVQLAVAGSAEDALFGPFRDALRREEQRGDPCGLATPPCPSAWQGAARRRLLLFRMQARRRSRWRLAGRLLLGRCGSAARRRAACGVTPERRLYEAATASSRCVEWSGEVGKVGSAAWWATTRPGARRLVRSFGLRSPPERFARTAPRRGVRAGALCLERRRSNGSG